VIWLERDCITWIQALPGYFWDVSYNLTLSRERMYSSRHVLGLQHVVKRFPSVLKHHTQHGPSTWLSCIFSTVGHPRSPDLCPWPAKRRPARACGLWSQRHTGWGHIYGWRLGDHQHYSAPRRPGQPYFCVHCASWLWRPVCRGAWAPLSHACCCTPSLALLRLGVLLRFPATSPASRHFLFHQSLPCWQVLFVPKIAMLLHNCSI